MSVNKAILLGNVVADPEVRHLDKNVAVATFRMATNERGREQPDGTRSPDRTEYHSIVAWRGLAEVVERYVRKGAPLYIEGKLRTRSYTAKDGSTRYITEIVADELELLGRRDNNPQQ